MSKPQIGVFQDHPGDFTAGSRLLLTLAAPYTNMHPAGMH